MTLPISLTCKTQEPSRTRTLRGTRGTSTGEGPQRRRQRRRRGEAARLDWPAAGRGSGAFNGCWSGRTAPSPAGALAHGHPVVSFGSEASAALLGPFWIKPAPRACFALARSKPAFLPHSPACLPSAAPSSFISARPGNPSFPGGWWAGGDVREGAPAYSPSSPPPQPPLAWRSRWGDGHTPRCRGVTGCSAD